MSIRFMDLHNCMHQWVLFAYVAAGRFKSKKNINFDDFFFIEMARSDVAIYSQLVHGLLNPYLVKGGGYRNFGPYFFFQRVFECHIFIYKNSTCGTCNICYSDDVQIYFVRFSQRLRKRTHLHFYRLG